MIYNEFQGGILPSKYQSGGMADMANVDILTEVGTARCNFGLVKESGTTITAPVMGATTKNGNTFFFSTTGVHTWNRSTGGSYTVATSNTVTGGHLGCCWFDNWMYYATEEKLGRMRYDGSSKDNTYQTFDNNGALYHPMAVLNRTINIGDEEKIGQRNESGGTWQGDMLELESHQDIALIIPFGYDIIIFTTAGQYHLRAGVFRYDTSSEASSSSDYVDEAGFRVAMTSNTSDEIFAVAGDNGDIYQFDGVKLHWFTQIKGVSSVSTSNYLSASVGKKSYFSIGDGVVYSLSHPVSGGQAVLNKEFTVSAGAEATIYSLTGWKNQLLVSWGLSGTYGVDKIDTNYATATIDLPVFMGKARNIRVYYESLPTGTSISISFKNDGDSSWTTKTMASGEVINNSIEKYVELKAEPGNKRTLEARITLNPYNTTPATPIITHSEVIPYE